MSLPIFDAFKKNFSHFVSHPDPREKKTMEYFATKSKSIYSTFLNGSSSTTLNDHDRFNFNRRYGRGEQSESLYKEIFTRGIVEVDGTVLDKASNFFVTQGEEEKKGFMSVLWRVVSPASTIVTNLLAITEQDEYNISCDPTDPISKDLAEEKKLHVIAVRDNLEFINSIEQQVGIPFDKPDFLPDNDEELLLYEKMGGFKPAFAEKMEVLLQHTEDISDFDRIASMCKRDAIENNQWCFREKYNPETCKVEYEYVDIECYIGQWSKYNDHRDSEYGAHWYEMSISQLYQWFPDEDQSFFENMAQSYCGHLGNPSDLLDEHKKQLGNRWGYDSWKVAVLHTEWLDVDSRQYEKTDKGNGKYKYREVDYDKVVDDKDKTTFFRDKRFRFECEWIIGMDIAFNYGKVYTVRPSAKDACLTYHHYTLDGQSKVELAIPFFDDFMITWVKMQNLFAYATNDLKFINMKKLLSLEDNPKDDGDRAIKTAVKKLLETGWGFYDMSGIGGVHDEQNDAAMEFYPGGMGTLFKECITKFELNAKLIETVTGINPIVLGSTPGNESPVATNLAAVQATSNTLKPIISGWFSSRKKAAENVARFIQILVQYNKNARDAYENVIGMFGCDIIEASIKENRKLSGKTNSTVDLGIKMDLRAGTLTRQEIMKASMTALTPGRDGMILWTLPDHILLTDMIESGKSTKLIWWTFSKIQERNKKKADAEAAQKAEQLNKFTLEQNAQKAKLTEDAKVADHARTMEILNAEKGISDSHVKLQETIRRGKELDKERLKLGQPVQDDVSPQELQQGQPDQPVQPVQPIPPQGGGQMYVGKDGKQYSEQDLQGIDINAAVQQGELVPA